MITSFHAMPVLVLAFSVLTWFFVIVWVVSDLSARSTRCEWWIWCIFHLTWGFAYYSIYISSPCEGAVFSTLKYSLRWILWKEKYFLHFFMFEPMSGWIVVYYYFCMNNTAILLKNCSFHAYSVFFFIWKIQQLISTNLSNQRHL